MNRYGIARSHNRRLEVLGVIDVPDSQGAIEATRRLAPAGIRYAGCVPWSELTVRQQATALRGIVIDDEGRVQGTLQLDGGGPR